MTIDSDKVSVPRLAHLQKGQKGYGFNLHGDKGKTVQTISAVDKDSAAELGGLRVGDIVIEVNGENVESLTHMEVVNLIKKKPDETTLLVCDKDTLAYLKMEERQCTADMVNLATVYVPPETPEPDPVVANGTATTEEVQEKTEEVVESAPAVIEDSSPTPPDPVTKEEEHEPAPSDTTPEEVKELNSVLEEQDKPAEQPEPPAQEPESTAQQPEPKPEPEPEPEPVQQNEEPPKPPEPEEAAKPNNNKVVDGLTFDINKARPNSNKRHAAKSDGQAWANKVSFMNEL